MINLRSIKDIDISNKTICLRVDLNVPTYEGKIINDERVIRLVPTIKYLLENNCKIVIMSHFGRPAGKVVKELSLKIVADYINDSNFGFSIKFISDCIGQEVENKVKQYSQGEVILLENLRFYEQETKNDYEFAASLAKLGDVYVNDAFSCSHRSHASIDAIAKILPSAAGLLLYEEISYLEQYLQEPKKPLLAIIGGAKISTKLLLFKNIIKKADIIFVGGAMANTFIKALGYDIGASLYEEDLIEEAKNIMSLAQDCNCEIMLPIDVVTALDTKNQITCNINLIDNIEPNSKILDVGPRTIKQIAEKIRDVQTIVWNGPLGVFELKPFDVGTQSIAREIVARAEEAELYTIIGGGDIVAALSETGLLHNFTYISTGGGAFLEWLEGKELPGLVNLRLSPVESIKDYLLL
jgi:phosphoglycerate kinase